MEYGKESNFARNTSYTVDSNISSVSDNELTEENIHMEDGNTMKGNTSSNSTTDDLVVGSLNLVSFYLIYN